MFCFRTAHTKKGQVVTVLIELYEFLPSFVSIERVTNILFPLTVGYVFFFSYSFNSVFAQGNFLF